jgi:hypothetical protein
MADQPIYCEGMKPVWSREPGGSVVVYRHELTEEERDEVSEYMRKRIEGYSILATQKNTQGEGT